VLFHVLVRVRGGIRIHLTEPQDREPRDTPLPALMIAVEQFYRPRLEFLDDLTGRPVLGGARVPEGALPESDVADRYEQVTGCRTNSSSGAWLSSRYHSG
jgi:hypothetical protein